MTPYVEPPITIRGVALTDGQAMAVRVAVTLMADRLRSEGGTSVVSTVYLARLAEVTELLRRQ